MALLEAVASAVTAAVANVNDAADRVGDDLGTPHENQVLTASNTLARMPMALAPSPIIGCVAVWIPGATGSDLPARRCG